MMSLAPAFLEAEAAAPPRPTGHCQWWKFLEFFLGGRYAATSHWPSTSAAKNDMSHSTVALTGAPKPPRSWELRHPVGSGRKQEQQVPEKGS